MHIKTYTLRNDTCTHKYIHIKHVDTPIHRKQMHHTHAHTQPVANMKITVLLQERKYHPEGKSGALVRDEVGQGVPASSLYYSCQLCW